MDEDNKAKSSLHFFFRCMGISLIILSVKTKAIYEVSVITIKTLWYTFLYVFMEAIWFGLAVMFVVDLYKYIKNRFL